MPLPPATLPAPTVFPNTVKAEPALSGSAFRFPCQKFAEKNSRLSTNRVFHVIMPILKNEGGIRHGPVAKHAYQCRSAGPCVSQQMRTTRNPSEIVIPRPEKGRGILHWLYQRQEAYRICGTPCYSVIRFQRPPHSGQPAGRWHRNSQTPRPLSSQERCQCPRPPFRRSNSPPDSPGRHH